MTLANATPHAALAAPLLAPDGRDVVLAVLKATFRRDARGRLMLADEQAPVLAADVPHDPDATESSIRYPGDLCVAKRGTDVIFIAEAVSAKLVLHVDVAVQVRGRRIALRVHGERTYYRGAVGVAIGQVAPFRRKPIVWERAYGGMLPDKSALERRNPVGRGFTKNPVTLLDTPAPQIEDPAQPITSASDRPVPVGLGAIGPHWSPRIECAGTFDAHWKRTRMPLMPLDFDVRHNNVAPPWLQFDPPLTGGEIIGTLGMVEEGGWTVELPAVRAVFHGRYADGRVQSVRPAVDTVVVEPAKGEVQLTLRYAFPMGRGKTVLREIRVDLDG
jgi:hypothetical protein